MEETQIEGQEQWTDEIENQEPIEGTFSDDADLGYSEPKPLGGLYALFGDILQMPRTTRVANLDKHELGELGMNVRDALRIAHIGKVFHHPVFAKFFLDQSSIVTDTSMSKKGWLPELFITSRKIAQRDNLQNLGIQQPKSKWKLFGKEEGVQQQ